jgi:hypothetical protein
MPQDRRKHIAISEELKKEFDMVAKLKGMTHEGLVRYFINNEIEKVRR